jgi:small membrane protein
MNAFQWITISSLTVVLLGDLRALLRAEGHSVLHLARLGLWALAIACVYRPELTSLAARAVGIDRGADLVSYAFHFAFLGTSLFFYSRYLQLRTTLTEVVRHMAIREAALGSAESEEA